MASAFNMSRSVSYPGVLNIGTSPIFRHSSSLHNLALVLQDIPMDNLACARSELSDQNAMGLRAHRFRTYLDDAEPLQLFEQKAEPDDIEFNAITHNVLHPGIARFDSNPKNRSNNRFWELAHYYKKQNIGLILTQESTPPALEAFQSKGFKSNSADEISPLQIIYAPDPMDSTQPEPRTAQLTFNDMRGNTNTSPSSFSSQSWLRSQWRGLTNYYHPQRYELDESLSETFFPYPPSLQKGWAHILVALLALLKAVVVFSGVDCVNKRARDFICSFSGIARENGLLITPLKDKKAKLTVFLCNTHLESFDHHIRLKQITYLFKLLEQIKARHPNAVLLMGADFNYPQQSKMHQSFYCDGFKQLIEKRLGALTLPEKKLCATLNNGLPEGADIDGLYVIPPHNHNIKEVNGKTLLPLYQGQDYRLSDHCAVVLGVRLEQKNKTLKKEVSDQG